MEISVCELKLTLVERYDEVEISINYKTYMDIMTHRKPNMIDNIISLAEQQSVLKDKHQTDALRAVHPVTNEKAFGIVLDISSSTDTIKFLENNGFEVEILQPSPVTN